MATWYVYMVRCRDNSLYTGISTDPRGRVKQHNQGGMQAAKYTRGRRPVTLVYTEEAASRADALKREYAIKQLKRQAKLRLIQQQ